MKMTNPVAVLDERLVGCTDTCPGDICLGGICQGKDRCAACGWAICPGDICPGIQLCCVRLGDQVPKAPMQGAIGIT